MLRRANVLVERARERIRLAAERDPHAWDDRDDHRALLVHDDEPEPFGDLDDGPHGDGRDRAPDPAPERAHGPTHDAGPEGGGRLDDDIAGGDDRPSLGSPEPGAPDLESAGGGVGGPPGSGGGRPASANRRLFERTGRPDRDAHEGHDGDTVPAGLRVAAAWSWRVILVGSLLYLLVQAMNLLLEIVVPVLVALLLAALLQPAAGALVRRKWPRSLAAFAMLLVGILVVAGIITLVVNRVVADWDSLTKQVGQGLTQVQKTIVRTFPITQSQLDTLVSQAQSALAGNRGALASGAISTAGTVTQVFTGILLTLLTLFFFLKDGRSIWLWLVGLMPRNARAYVDEAARRSWRTLVSYVRATVAVALIDAIGIGIGLVILRVPLALPLAALVFIGAFIPIIGSFVAGTVAVLVALVSNGFIVALIVLGVVLLVMQLEGHVFSPLLLGRAVRVHPLAVVLSIASGLILGGVFGALIAVPIVACLNVGGSYLVHRHDGPRPPEPRPDRARPAVTAK
jgi:predicted PurR-regulated permease PerM